MFVNSNGQAQPTGTGIRGDGENDLYADVHADVHADVDAVRRGVDRNAELDTVEHDLRDLRR